MRTAIATDCDCETCEVTLHDANGRSIRCERPAEWRVSKRAMGPYPAHRYCACTEHAEASREVGKR